MSRPEDILKEGDLFSATIEDDVASVGLSSQEGRELIVSYRGYLFRVKNSTGKKFRKGDRLELLVVGTRPFELRLMGDTPKSLNRFV